MINLLDMIDIRNEYEIVIPIDIIISSVINDSVLEEINFSMMVSLEKKPDINGIPISDNLVMPIIEEVNGMIYIFKPIIRIS